MRRSWGGWGPRRLLAPSMAEINTPIEQLSVRRACAQLAWFHGWNDDRWNEQMKGYMDTGKFTLFCAK
jgi:hypothetical protein